MADFHGSIPTNLVEKEPRKLRGVTCTCGRLARVLVGTRLPAGRYSGKRSELTGYASAN